MKYKFFVSFIYNDGTGNQVDNCCFNCRKRNITQEILAEWTKIIVDKYQANACKILSFQKIK